MKKLIINRTVLQFLLTFLLLSCTETKPKDKLYFVEIFSDQLQTNGRYEYELTVDSIFAKEVHEAYKKALIKVGGVEVATKLLNQRKEGTNLAKGRGVFYFRLLDSHGYSVFADLDILKIDSINRSTENVLPNNIFDKFLYK